MMNGLNRGSDAAAPASHHRVGHLGPSVQSWRTPRWLFDQLNAEFRFTLDAAASSENALCSRYLTEEDDALSRLWTGSVFVNPPYKKLWPWVHHAWKSMAFTGATVVMLLPASTGSRWFHEIVQPHAEVRFLQGRLKFEGAKHPATFDSMVTVFRPWKVQQ